MSVHWVVGGSAEMYALWVFQGSAQLHQEAEESHTARDQVRLSQLMKSISRCEGFPKLLTASRGSLPSLSR